MILTVILTGWWWLALIYILSSIGTYFYMQKSEYNNKNAYNYMNLMNTMLLGGLWHGASWAFVFWGFLHGSYQVVQRLGGPIWNKILDAVSTPKFLKDCLAMALVYASTCFAWIYFRAPDFEVASQVIMGIASLEAFNFGSVINKFWVIKGVLVIGILLFVEILDVRFTLWKSIQTQPAFRIISFVLLLWAIAFFGSFGANSFIYFQF